MTTTIIFPTPVDIVAFAKTHQLDPSCTQKNYHLIKEIAIRQVNTGLVSIVTEGEYPQNSRFFALPSATLTSYIEAVKPEATNQARKQEALKDLLLEIVRQPPQTQVHYLTARMSPQEAMQNLRDAFARTGLSMDKVIVWDTPFPEVKGYIGVHFFRSHA